MSRNSFDILIVEDEPIVVDAADRILVSQGYAIDRAFEAGTAVRKLEEANYRLIIADLMLPVFTGFEFLQKVKAEHPEIPVIIMTGYATVENAIQAFKYGAFDFIPKPFDVDELLGVVNRGLHFLVREETEVSHLHEANELYFLGGHSIARLNDDQTVTICVGKTFPRVMGQIRSVELPSTDTEILQGNACARILCDGDMSHRVWSPLSGRIVEINRELEKTPILIEEFPLTEGWLVRMVPTNLENEVLSLAYETRNPKSEIRNKSE